MDPMFSLETLLEQVLTWLKGQTGRRPTAEIAAEMQLPYWAVDRTLEVAYLAKKADFREGEGWALVGDRS